MTVLVTHAGGHTAEMLKLVRVMDLSRYTPRTYVMANTDNMSASKAKAQENELAALQQQCKLSSAAVESKELAPVCHTG